MLDYIAKLISLKFGWKPTKIGEYVILVEDNRVELYIFNRGDNLIRRVYGYYSTHFIDVFEGNRIKEGLERIGSIDRKFKEVVEYLMGFGFKLIRRVH